MGQTWFLALWHFLLQGCTRQGFAWAQSPGFLVISAPRNPRISWVRLPEDGNSNKMKPMTLIDEGLHHPQGIAVDQKRKRLFVADPDVQKIYSYQLSIDGDTLSTYGPQMVVSRTAESRWVAVDGVGNLFFSDEPQNLILRVPADKVLRGDPTPEVVYNGNMLTEVNQPGGVAVDNLHVYWTNKHFGMQAGSVIRASEFPESSIGGPAKSISVLARNTVKSYGVCLALGNVYYTNSEKSVFGVKKTGGPVGEVTSKLTHPRGCSWDGDGTVYVADRAGAVYSFAGNMHNIGVAEVSRVFEVEDAFGLSVLQNAARGCRDAVLPFALTFALIPVLLQR